MDKIKVNNQVVKMRKFVKQAKVHIINKFVKELKHLQVKKGTEAQVEKNKRKSERILSEIEIIKKINVDTVSKMSLLKQKDWKAVLDSKTADLNDRSFALLANFEPLQKEVETFHSQNPHLIEVLPDFLQQWEQKQKTPSKHITASEIRKKKKEKMIKKIQAKFSKATGKEVKNKKENADKVDNHDSPVRSTKLLNIEKSDDDDEDKSLHVKDESDIEEGDSLHIKNDNDSSLKPVILIEDNERRVKDVKKMSFVSEKSKQNKVKSKLVTPINLEQLKNCDEIPVNNEADNNDDDSERDSSPKVTEISSHAKDPFFISNDGDNLDHNDDSIVQDSNSESNDSILSNEQSPQAGKTKFKKNFHKSIKFPKGHKMPNQNIGGFKNMSKYEHSKSEAVLRKRDYKNQSFKNKPVRNSGNLKESGPRSFKDSKVNSKLSKYVSKSLNETSHGLHPSWEAKKKLGEKAKTILPFQGKKITFDD